MEKAESEPHRRWKGALEKRCTALLQTGDALLDRYPRQRRRPGDSLAAGPLLNALEQLCGLEDCLEKSDRKWLLPWKSGLEERLYVLRQRRIPPSTDLRRFRAQCRELSRWLIQLRQSEEPLLDPLISWEMPDVLVGSLRRPSQLDICLMHGFYHVPCCQIPQERLPIRYVAIYQSRSLFSDDCGIQFYGRVKRCIPVRRWEISEIPKCSDEWYYRLEVLRWEQLEPPIAVREVPFTHLFTNLFLLTHSQETPELYLNSELEYRYYQSLKAALQRGNGIVLRHPNGKVRLKERTLRVYRGLFPVASFPIGDFQRTPSAVFGKIMGLLEK